MAQGYYWNYMSRNKSTYYDAWHSAGPQTMLIIITITNK